jgi:hypothetical protein
VGMSEGGDYFLDRSGDIRLDSPRSQQGEGEGEGGDYHPSSVNSSAILQDYQNMYHGVPEVMVDGSDRGGVFLPRHSSPVKVSNSSCACDEYLCGQACMLIIEH